MKNDKITLNWLPKKTFEIIATIPWLEINEAQELVIKDAGENMEIKGFRKGKAPAKIILENIDKQKLLESILNKIIPSYYQEAILKNNLKPVISPQIELVSAKENEDWQIKLISCEAPDVKLLNYKEEIAKENSVGKIWKPGESVAKNSKEEKDLGDKRDEKLQKAIDWFLKNIKLEISDLLVDHEVRQKLSQLIDQTQKLGLTVDQYLASSGKTIDSLKEEYRSNAEKNLTMEFILHKVADEEKIEVKDEEVEKALSTAKTQEERKSLEKEKYFLTSLIRQQKTLDFLASL